MVVHPASHTTFTAPVTLIHSTPLPLTTTTPHPIPSPPSPRHHIPHSSPHHHHSHHHSQLVPPCLPHSHHPSSHLLPPGTMSCALSRMRASTSSGREALLAGTARAAGDNGGRGTNSAGLVGERGALATDEMLTAKWRRDWGEGELVCFLNEGGGWNESGGLDENGEWGYARPALHCNPPHHPSHIPIPFSPCSRPALLSSHHLILTSTPIISQSKSP